MARDRRAFGVPERASGGRRAPAPGSGTSDLEGGEALADDPVAGEEALGGEV